MNFKKIISVLVATMCALSLFAACSANKDKDTTTDNNGTTVNDMDKNTQDATPDNDLTDSMDELKEDVKDTADNIKDDLKGESDGLGMDKANPNNSTNN